MPPSVASARSACRSPWPPPAALVDTKPMNRFCDYLPSAPRGSPDPPPRRKHNHFDSLRLISYHFSLFQQKSPSHCAYGYPSERKNKDKTSSFSHVTTRSKRRNDVSEICCNITRGGSCKLSLAYSSSYLSGGYGGSKTNITNKPMISL